MNLRKQDGLYLPKKFQISNQIVDKITNDKLTLHDVVDEEYHQTPAVQLKFLHANQKFKLSQKQALRI